MTQDRGVWLDPAALRQAMPFHFAVSREGKLQQIGRAWERRLPEMQVGQPFDAHFEIKQPLLAVFDQGGLLANDSPVIVFHKGIGLVLRAQVLATGEGLLFLASPRVSQFDEVKRAGLRLDDFPIHEGVTEQLFSLHTQELALVEARCFAEKLRAQKAELRGLNQRLQDEMGEVRRAKHESEQLQKRIQEAERLESLGVLAGGIAHDFNNLLVPIVANAEWLREDGQASDGIGNADDILEAAEMAKKLCQKMLSYAGRSQVKLEPVELSSLVETSRVSLEGLAPKANLEFELHASPEGFRVDSDQVEEVLVHLVQNAAEACASAFGRIMVRTGSYLLGEGPHCVDTVVGEIDPAGSYAYLEVQDDGVGMPAETLERAFDPFFSTKRMGRGLGMAVVFGIVRRHDGVLMIRSAPGEGTKVTILFPVLEPRATARNLEETDWTAPNSGTVLLVDDDLGVRDVAERMLIRRGCHIVSAADGFEALTRCREIGHDLSFVLLDLSMPALDGDRVYRDLRAKWPQLPVVLMSGYASERVGDLLRGDERAHFLQKPFTTAELAHAMEQVGVGDACTA